MFSLVNYNVRIFRTNAEYFLPIIEKSSIHALVLTETWFTDAYQGSIVNYNSYHTIRSDRRSGGVSVFVDKNFHSHMIVNLCYANQNIEICTVRIMLGDEPIFILGIYRPHSGTINSFCDEIATIMQDPILRNRRCFLTGDININLIQESSVHSHFVDTLQSHHFFPVICLPTRYSPNADDNIQPSLLDQIWCNSLNMYNAGVVQYDITDHLPAFLQFPFSSPNTSAEESIKISFRINNKENREKFRRVVTDFD